MIASHLKLPSNKVHDILYSSYLDLVKSLGEHPHPVAECIHAIYVNIPWDRHEDRKARERLQESFLYAEFNLPVTPRLGEHIRIEFLDRDIKYTYGVVTEVHHEIRAHTQRILIYVDPFNNFYWKWDKLKQEHQEQERWARYLNETRT